MTRATHLHYLYNYLSNYRTCHLPVFIIIYIFIFCFLFLPQMRFLMFVFTICSFLKKLVATKIYCDYFFHNIIL